MDAAVSLLLAFGLGVGLTFNAAIIAGMSRARGGREGALLTPVSAIPVIAVLLAWIAYDEGGTQLPVPFEALAAMAGIIVLSVPLLWLVVRGLPPWYGTAGFLNGLGLVLVPRFIEDLGMALYVSATTLGSCGRALLRPFRVAWVRGEACFSSAHGRACDGGGWRCPREGGMTRYRAILRPGTDLLPAGLSFLGGALAAPGIAMIGAVGRQRGGEEATFLHMSMLAAGLSLVLAAFAARGAKPAFPRPLDSGWSLALIGAALGAVAALSARGLEWYYATSGMISVAIFLMITWSLVRLSLGLYFASGTLGQVAGSLVVDQVGAFGAPQHDITVFRLVALVLIGAGVVVVRTGK